MAGVGVDAADGAYSVRASGAAVGWGGASFLGFVDRAGGCGDACGVGAVLLRWAGAGGGFGGG